jgi:hypothetical protein
MLLLKTTLNFPLSKHQMAAVSSSSSTTDKFVNPQDQSFHSLGEANPPIKFKNALAEMSPLYVTLQETKKFIHASNQRRLALSVGMDSEVDSSVVSLYFTEALGTEIKIRAVVKTAVQQFVPFEIEDDSDIKIKLRTRTNGDLIDELIALAHDKGVEIVPLVDGDAPNTTSAGGYYGSDTYDSKRTDAYMPTPAELERQAAERKRREEEEFAARHPLKYPPADVSERSIGAKGCIMLGDLHGVDIDAEENLDDWNDVSDSTAVEILPPTKSEAEWNTLGALIYKQSGIHAQKWSLFELLHKHLSLVVESDDNKLKHRNYTSTDTEEMFTTRGQYADVDRFNRAVAIFYPPSHPDEGTIRIQTADRKFIELKSPEKFSIVFEFSASAGDEAAKTYLIHKFRIVSDEVGANKRALATIERKLKADVDKLVSELSTTQKYANFAETRRQVAAAQPVQQTASTYYGASSSAPTTAGVPLSRPAPMVRAPAAPLPKAGERLF